MFGHRHLASHRDCWPSLARQRPIALRTLLGQRYNTSPAITTRHVLPATVDPTRRNPVAAVPGTWHTASDRGAAVSFVDVEASRSASSADTKVTTSTPLPGWVG
jgi:hypothetical protein